MVFSLLSCKLLECIPVSIWKSNYNRNRTKLNHPIIHFVCVYVCVCVCVLQYPRRGCFVCACVLACLCARVCVDWLAARSVIAAVSLWLERWLRCWLLPHFGHRRTRNWPESVALSLPPPSEREPAAFLCPIPWTRASRQLCCVNKATQMRAATLSIVVYSYCVGPFFDPNILLASVQNTPDHATLWWKFVAGWCWTHVYLWQ